MKFYPKLLVHRQLDGRYCLVYTVRQRSRTNLLYKRLPFPLFYEEKAVAALAEFGSRATTEAQETLLQIRAGR